MITDWPMFWAHIVVGIGTVLIAVFSVIAARRAAEAADRANPLSERAAREAANAFEREVEKAEREQASRIWVSMIVVT